MIVGHKQTILDMSLMAYGNVDNVLALLLANGISLTDDVEPGTALIVPAIETEDADIVNYYTRKTIKPATGLEPKKPVVTKQILTISNMPLTVGGHVVVFTD